MSGERSGNDPGSVPAVPESVIIIRFSAPGAADPIVTVGRCTLGQLAAAAFELDAMTREARLARAMQQLAGGPSIALPGMADLSRIIGGNHG